MSMQSCRKIRPAVLEIQLETILEYSCRTVIQIIGSPTADPDFVIAGPRLVVHLARIMGHVHVKLQKDPTSGFRDTAWNNPQV